MSANIGTRIFKQEAIFIAGAMKKEQLPKIDLPQFAFIGKSNVGKSSLINMICRRKNLARVSHTPGRTQQINFFLIVRKLIMVDFPGYGFAKVPLKEKQNWENLILYYLKNTSNLRLVNVLIDARRGIQENDLKIIKLLKLYNKQIQLIFTKIDKVKLGTNFKLETENYLSNLGCSLYGIIFSSNRNGLGAKELQISLLKSLKL